MDKQPPKNLQDSFSELVTEWERNYDAFANQLMGTESYSQAMNQMQKTQLASQKAFAETMAQQMAAFNIPTRDDVMGLADIMHQLGLRLERIEEKLGVTEAPAARNRKRPARTKQPAPAAEPAPATATGNADKDAKKKKKGKKS